ncbi:MAG: alpha/beta hydrolase [Acidimicrobiia bacterium]
MPTSRARSSQIEVASGREIAIAQYGDLKSKRVLFWFHGTPGGRHQIPPASIDAASESGVRIITMDRPGIGQTRPFRYASLAAWPGDLAAIADALKIDEFHVGGLSGGGPYALAAAAQLGSRVQSVLGWGSVAPTRGDSAIAGGLAGFARHLDFLWSRAEAPLGFVLHRMIQLTNPIAPQAIDAFGHFVATEADGAFLKRQDTKDMFLKDMIEASRGQFRAAIADARLFSRPWGFALAEIEQPVTLMFGDADNIVPHAHGEHLAKVLPNAELVTIPGGGHISILDELAAYIPKL